MPEEPSVLEVRGLEVVVPGEESLGEVTTATSFFKCELWSAGEEVLDILFS